MAEPLYPLNDLIFDFVLKSFNASTGAYDPITTGTVTAFLATSNLPTATAADPSLSVSCTYASNGKWNATFDAATLTASLCNSLFASATPYLIISKANDVRLVVTMVYTPARDVTPA